MKATIEFQLPEEQGEYDMFSKANKMYQALWQIQNNVRSKWKYAENLKDGYGEVDEIYSMICDEIGELLDENT